jgi:hypothetical protein
MGLHELIVFHPFENGISHDNKVMEILSTMMMKNVQRHHDVMTFCRTRPVAGKVHSDRLRGKSNVSRIVVDLQSGLGSHRPRWGLSANTRVQS